MNGLENYIQANLANSVARPYQGLISGGVHFLWLFLEELNFNGNFLLMLYQVGLQ